MSRLKNKFAGADDIYLTKKSICVRNLTTYNKGNGVYHRVDKTRYYPKTAKNLKLAGSLVGHIRYGR